MIWTRSDIVDAPAASAGAAAPPRDAIGATAIGAGCVALAVIAALVQMRTTGTATPTADSLAYFAVADQIAKVGYGPALPLHWSALYPLYLLLLRRLTAGQGIDELALTSAGDAVLLVAACGVTAVALASVASRCWPERPRVQASWVAAGCATALFLCFADLRVGLRMPDALVTSLAVATVALWAHAIDRGMDLRFAAAAGLTSGLAFLTRANLLHWSIGVALVALTVAPAALRRRAAALAVFAAALTLVSAPHVVALSRARGHFVYGESGKLVFAETYGATWASDGHRWPVRDAGGDVQLFPDFREVNFPGFYDPGREFDDADVRFAWGKALRGVARSVQSTLLGYWTPSFALMWPLLWAMWPLALYGGAARRDRITTRERIGWLFVLSGLGGFAMHLLSFSIGYYLPPYFLALTAGIALLVLATDDTRAAAPALRAYFVVAAGFVAATALVVASGVRTAAVRARGASLTEARSVAASLSELPAPDGRLRPIAVAGDWLTLYGARLSSSQVLASIPDPGVLGESPRFDRALSALRARGIVALLARREDIALGDSRGWTAVSGTRWALLDLTRTADGDAPTEAARR